MAKHRNILSEFNEFYEMLLEYHALLNKLLGRNITKTEEAQGSKLFNKSI